MDKSMTDLQRRAEHARDSLQRAVAEALDRKRRLGQYAVICLNGKPVRVEADELGNYYHLEPTDKTDKPDKAR